MRLKCRNKQIQNSEFRIQKFGFRFAAHGAACVLVFLASASLTGCGPSVSVSEQSAANAASSGVSTKEIKLIRADAAALNALVASHKGQVVLVDYWATWCGPCVANFPHTVELAKKYRNQGLATIAVSFDLLDDESKVRTFLAQQGADFENLISQHDSIGQKPAEDFDIAPLPEYRLYDRQGKLRKKWEGKPEGIETMIEKLLAEN